MASKVYAIRDRLTGRYLVTIDRKDGILVGRWNQEFRPMNLKEIKYLISKLIDNRRKFELSTADVVAFDLVEGKTTTSMKKIVDDQEQKTILERLKQNGTGYL